MPSKFDAIFGVGLSSFYDVLNTLAVYTAPDGTTHEDIPVIISRNDAHQVDRNIRTTGELQTAEIQVRQSELPKPVRGGRFSIGMEVWTIETTPVLKLGEHFCTCSRSGTERLMPRRAADNA